MTQESLDPREVVALDRSESALSPSASPVGTPWLSADEAADYLRCPVSRVRKLTAAEAVPHHRDGRRVLYHREELDDYVRRGGAYAG